MGNIFDQEGITFESSQMASTNPNTGPTKFDVPAINASELQKKTQLTGPVPKPPTPQQLVALPQGPQSAADEAVAAAGAAPPQPQAPNLFDIENLSPVGSNAFTRGIYLNNETTLGQQEPLDEQGSVQAYMAQQMAETEQLARLRFTPEQLSGFRNNPVSMAEAIFMQNDWQDVPDLLDKYQSGGELSDTERARLDEYTGTMLQHNMRGYSWNGGMAMTGQQMPDAAISYLRSGKSGYLPEDGQEPLEPSLSGQRLMPAPYTPKVGEKPLNDFSAVTDKGRQIMATANDKPAITALKAAVHLSPDAAKNPLAQKGALITSINDLPASFRSALFDAVKERDPKAQMSKVFTPSGFNKALDTLGEEEVATIAQSHSPSFKERFLLNLADAYYNGTLSGAATQLAASQLKVGQNTNTVKSNIQARKKEFETLPSFSNTSEAIAALTGQVAGSIPTPESFITLPAKVIMAAGKGLGLAGEKLAQYLIREGKVNQVVRQGLEASAINAATDPLVQGLNVAAGAKEEFAPEQTLIAVPLGFLVGGTIKGLEVSISGKPKSGSPVDQYMASIRPDTDQMMVDSGIVSVEGGKSASATAAENILRGKGIEAAQATETVANMTANELDQFVNRHIPTPRGTYDEPPLPAGTPTSDAATAIAESQIKALNEKDPPPINDDESGWQLMIGKQKLSGGLLYRRLVNVFQPVENAEKLALQRGAVIQPGESPTVLGTLYGNVGATINHYLGVETFKWSADGSVEVTGRGLKSIMDDFDNVAKRWEPKRETRTRDFNDYLLAQRYLELERAGEGKVKPNQVEWSNQRLTALVEKYGDDIQLVENLSQEVYAFQRRTLDMLVDSGVIAPEQRDVLNKKYQRYIPLNRMFDEADHQAYLQAQRVILTAEKGQGVTSRQEKKARKVMKQLVEKYGEDVDKILSWHPNDRAGGGKPMGKFTDAGPQGLIKKLKGSDREVRQPLLNIFENTYEAVDRAFRNKVNRSIVNLKDVLPEYIQPTKAQRVHKGKAQVKIVHDPVLDQKLDAAIEYFSHSFIREKSVKVGGFKNVLGSYSPQEKMVRSSLGANEAVKTHEVGHLLDYELGVGERLLADAEIKAQLQKLAEERIPAHTVASQGDDGMELVEMKGDVSKKFKDYIKNDREVIANLYDAYVNAPELLDRIAPKAKAAFEAMLDEKPELAFIKDIKPSLNRSTRTVESDVWGEADNLPEGVIASWVNGERQLYRVSKSIYEAMKQLGPARVGVLEQIFNGLGLRLSAQALRFGATTTISFITRNLFRDQISAMIQGGVRYNPPWDFTKGLFASIGHGKLYQDWERAGGRMSFMPFGDEAMEKSMREMLEGEGRLKQALMILPKISEKVEQATRIGLYNAAKRSGKSDLEAAIASLEGTLNFGRGGDITKIANRYIPFLNAGVQGVDRIYRLAKTNPKAVVMWGVGTLTLPSVAITGYYLYGADEKTRQEYLEIPQWQKDMFWTVKIDGEWRSFPKPFSLGYLFSSIPERIMTWSYYQGRDDARDMWDGMMLGLFGSLVPINDASAAIPPAIKVAIEWQTNYNMYFDRSIYPEWMENLPPEQRKNAYTSKTAEAIGEMFGQSPAKIENTIRGLTGGLGGYGLRTGDNILNQVKEWNGTPVAEKPLTDADNILIQGFTLRHPSGMNSNSVREFNDNYDQAKQAHLGQKNIADDEKASYMKENQLLLESYRSMDMSRKAISRLQKQTSRIYNDTEMNGEQKLEQLLEINQQITNIAREANIQYNQALKAQEE